MTDSIYVTCSAQFDANEDLSGLLQCISDGHDEVGKSAVARDILCSQHFANTTPSPQTRDAGATSLASGVDTVCYSDC